MPEHKIQSTDGAPDIKLQLVPKLLKPLVKFWVPEAFVVSFKLETDSTILLSKAEKALKTYEHKIVVANLLQSRKREVVMVSAEAKEKLTLSAEETSANLEIEKKIVAYLKGRHDAYCKAKQADKQKE